jgi:hypothetical protein
MDRLFSLFRPSPIEFSSLPDSIEQFLTEMKAAIDARSKGASWDVSIDGNHIKVTMQREEDNEDTEYKFDIGGCITFVYRPPLWEEGEGKILLKNYYFEEGCPGNLLMSHQSFFDFLDKVGKKLDVAELNLADGSSKDLKWCRLPKDIFALAGYSTFYARFDFKNPRFDAHIQRIRNLPLSDFVLLLKRQSVVKRRTRGISKFLRNYDPFTEKTTVGQVARFIVDTCKKAFKTRNDEGRLPEALAVDVQKANRLFDLLTLSYPSAEVPFSVKRLRGGRSKRVRVFKSFCNGERRSSTKKKYS